jgi:hypothetical protein
MRSGRAIRPELPRGGQEARTSLALVVLRFQGVHGTAPNRGAVGPIRFPDIGCPGPPAFRSLPFLRPNAGDDVGPALFQPLQRPARLSGSPPKSGKRFLLKLALCPNRQDYGMVT